MNPYQIGDYDWESETDKAISMTAESAIKNFKSNIEFGTVIGDDDPWKFLDDNMVSNPWNPDLKPSSTLLSTDNWANFDSNNFAEFDTHFTDFEPISTTFGNMVNNMSDIKTHDSTPANESSQIHQSTSSQKNEINVDDLKFNKLTIRKNLIPGADGRLVLETNVVPFENKSDKNANIHTDIHSETELDNFRFVNF